MNLERKLKKVLTFGLAGAIFFNGELHSYTSKNNSRELLTEEKIKDSGYNVLKKRLEKVPDELLKGKFEDTQSTDSYQIVYLKPVEKPKTPPTLKKVLENYGVQKNQIRSISRVLENTEYSKGPNKDYVGRYDNNGKIEVQREENSFYWFRS